MIAIYIRTSTDEQNPENQLADIESMIGDKEYSLFEDMQSAWKDTDDRVKFSELKELIRRKKIKKLYVWDLDRLYRNRKRLIAFFEFCKIYKCNVLSFRQKWLNELSLIPEPFNEIMFNLMLNLMGWLAEDESSKKSQRIKSAVRTKNGETISNKGNKWGRKGLSKQTIDRVIKLKSDKPRMSIRKIAEECYYYDKNGNKKNLSKSAVHKLLFEKSVEKDSKTPYPSINYFKDKMILAKGSNSNMNYNIPVNMGVYFCFDANKELVYIGYSKNIRERIASHISDGSTIIGGSNIPVGLVKYVSWLCFDTQEEACNFEVYYIKLYKPEYNTEHND